MGCLLLSVVLAGNLRCRFGVHRCHCQVADSAADNDEDDSQQAVTERARHAAGKAERNRREPRVLLRYSRECVCY